jgi:hypothetical protein
MATGFFGAGRGIRLVRTLVPIAVNARKPKVKNAAAVPCPPQVVLSDSAMNLQLTYQRVDCSI